MNVHEPTDQPAAVPRRVCRLPGSTGGPWGPSCVSSASQPRLDRHCISEPFPSPNHNQPLQVAMTLPSRQSLPCTGRGHITARAPTYQMSGKVQMEKEMGMGISIHADCSADGYRDRRSRLPACLSGLDGSRCWWRRSLESRPFHAFVCGPRDSIGMIET